MPASRCFQGVFMSPHKRPRPVALVVVRDGARIFVCECRDPATGQWFYRPPGGQIKFGEHGAEAAVREMGEETGAQLTGVRYLGMLESIFEYGGKPGHEIALIYEATFADPACYGVAWLPRLDRPGENRRVVWRALDSFEGGGPPLYPEGLLVLLQEGLAGRPTQPVQRAGRNVRGQRDVQENVSDTDAGRGGCTQG